MVWGSSPDGGTYTETVSSSPEETRGKPPRTIWLLDEWLCIHLCRQHSKIYIYIYKKEWKKCELTTPTSSNTNITWKKNKKGLINRCDRPSPSPPSCSWCCPPPWPSALKAGTATGRHRRTLSGNRRRRRNTVHSPSRRTRSSGRRPQSPAWENTGSHLKKTIISCICYYEKNNLRNFTALKTSPLYLYKYLPSFVK